MKPKRNFFCLDVAMVLLLVLCVALAAVVAWLRPVLLIPVGAVLLMATLMVLVGLRTLRRRVRYALVGRRGEANADESGLARLSVPALLLSDKTIVWYNEAFAAEIAGVDVATLPLDKVLPGLKPGEAEQDLQLAGKRYSVRASEEAGGLRLFLFFEDTLLKERSAEYLASRPAVLYIVIDTFDELSGEMSDTDRARMVASIDTELEKFIGRSSGFLRRMATSRYLAVVEERHVAEMVEKRFDVLDTVRRLDEESQLVTLSIGVGRGGASFKECEEMAAGALEMALGRGGDQAAVRSPDGYSFFGGVARSVERRSKVKSRIIAGSIRTLVNESDRVLVMGHKNSDMDSIGASVGMLRFARTCDKPAALVLNTKKTMAGPLVEALFEEGYGDYILSPDEALQVATARTLLIIVDTHMRYLLESEEVFNACGKVVLIDHHRRMVGYIDNAAVFYHEPYASSASELVTELLSYTGGGKDQRATPFEAEAMLAGIMLDTRTFSLHVGVRTFEAAAALRRWGAKTEAVKRWFASSFEDYRWRSELVAQAEVADGFAMVLSDELPIDSEVVAPQAANDLLTIDNVQASVVAIRQGDEIRVSARSMGEVNVQLVMEKLGGGGHQTMAGAQLKGVELDEAYDQIAGAIRAYREERKAAEAAVETGG